MRDPILTNPRRGVPIRGDDDDLARQNNHTSTMGSLADPSPRLMANTPLPAHFHVLVRETVRVRGNHFRKSIFLRNSSEFPTMRE